MIDQLEVMQALRPSADYCIEGEITESTIENCIRYVTGVDNDIAIFGEPSDPVTWSQFVAKRTEIETEKAAKQIQAEADKASAVSKLQALGLTDAEIKALSGGL